jgi:hypothetical protein
MQENKFIVTPAGDESQSTYKLEDNDSTSDIELGHSNPSQARLHNPKPYPSQPYATSAIPDGF